MHPTAYARVTNKVGSMQFLPPVAIFPKYDTVHRSEQVMDWIAQGVCIGIPF